MTDLDRAIAGAREALARYENLAECSADYDPCAHEITGKLSDLLAALDAARGEAVATVQTITSLVGETRKVIIGKAEVIDALPVGTAVYAAPPAALAVMQDLSERFSAMHAQGDVWITSLAAAKTVQAAMLAQQPAAAVPNRMPDVDPAEDQRAADYHNGWNDCRAWLIAAAERAKGAGNE